MSNRGGVALYTPEILALAVELSRYPLDDSLPLLGAAQSRVCGSQIEIGLDANDHGRIGTLGGRVSACAIGQASAALFLRSASGCDADDLDVSLAEIEAWLSGSDTMPSWPGIAILASARAFPARHAAILLPWKAALAALSNRVGAA